MFVYIGPHTNWIGPYQIAEKLLFWMDKDDDRIMKLGDWLGTTRSGEPSYLARFCEWVESKKKRTRVIKIHKYDTWSVDSTLAPIITPLLKQLKETKHGAPYVDPSDVPTHLHPDPRVDEYGVDNTHFDRWDWVLDEMIYAFETIQTDWEAVYHTGTIDFVSTVARVDETGKPLSYLLERGPNDTSAFDREGWETQNARIRNGFRLFGVYYQNLWD